MGTGQLKAPPLPSREELMKLIPVHKPTFGLEKSDAVKTADDVSITWLGFVVPL